MNRKKTKLPSLMLALAVTFVALTACGKAESAEQNEEAQNLSSQNQVQMEESAAPNQSKSQPETEPHQGTDRPTPETVRSRLTDPILSWYPGTAGSSLKLVAVAAEVLSFASEYNGTADLGAVWNELPEGEQQRFQENLTAILEQLDEIRSDYPAVSGLCEDAGIAEEISELIKQEGIWDDLDLLSWQLEHPFADLGASDQFTEAERKAAVNSSGSDLQGKETAACSSGSEDAELSCRESVQSAQWVHPRR